MGDWFVGKDHFFAVANTKESRKDEKGRWLTLDRPWRIQNDFMRIGILL